MLVLAHHADDPELATASWACLAPVVARVFSALPDRLGFRSRVVAQDTDDPNADGLVISQSPDGGSQAPAKTVVTLTVGRYVAAPTDTTTTTPTTLTPTTPTPNP